MSARKGTGLPSYVYVASSWRNLGPLDPDTRDTLPVLAFRDGDRGCIGWSLADYRRGAIWIQHSDTLEIRPLVVIDPEDRGHLKRLLTAIYNQPDPLSPTLHGLADALIEFANPTPPKPAEPTGLGAVVEDAEGVLWTRTALDDYAAWLSSNPGGTPTRTGWSEVAAVRVLSEGVTA